MIRNSQKIQSLLFGIFLIASTQVLSQSKYVPSANQMLKVEGTSTIHDWEMVSSKVEGEVSISVQDAKITDIGPFKVNVPVNSIKSEKKSMDENAYEALNAKKYPQIVLELIDAAEISDQLIKANCNITISGTTNRIALDVNYKVSGNAISFVGSFPITFTQFKVDPPKAMLGTIKTGDKLKISFETTFTKTN